MDLNQQRIRIIESKKLIQSIPPSSDLDVSDLYIPPNSEILESAIQAHLSQTKKKLKNIQEDHSLKNLFKEPRTFLNSYLNREARDKVFVDEKNVFAPQFCTQEPINPLLADTMMVRYAIYHPVSDKKTQEWLIPSSMPISKIFENLDCLAELISFQQADISYLFLNEKVSNLSIPLENLQISIGQNYFLTHKESCIHRLQILEVYLITENDIKERSMYPLRVFKSKTQKRKCEICSIFYAKFLCLDAPSVPKRVCFMCNKCLDGLFPSKKDFNIYPYYYDSLF